MEFQNKLTEHYDPKRECRGNYNPFRNDYDLRSLREVFVKIFSGEEFDGVFYDEEKINLMSRPDMCEVIQKAYTLLGEKDKEEFVPKSKKRAIIEIEPQSHKKQMLSKSEVVFVDFKRFGAAAKYLLKQKEIKQNYEIQNFGAFIKNREKSYISSDICTTLMFVDDKISGFGFFSIGADDNNILYAKGTFSVAHSQLDHAKELVEYVFHYLLDERQVEYIYLDVNASLDTKNWNIAFMCATYKAVAKEDNYSILFSHPTNFRHTDVTYEEHNLIDESCFQEYQFIIVSKLNRVALNEDRNQVLVTDGKKVEKPPPKDLAFAETKLSEKDSCLNGYEIKEEIDHGVNAKVYKACKPKCTYAIKKLKKLDITEIEIGHWMGEEGVGPKLYAYWFCESEKMWYVVYERIKGITLGKWFLKTESICLPQDISDMIMSKVDKMHALGVHHNDLHGNNIMLQTDGNENVVDAFVIDFDRASYHSTTNGLPGTLIYIDLDTFLADLEIC